MTTSTKILIEKHIAVDLALRNSVDKFFDLIESKKEEKIVIDFNKINSISRSFAHQYYIRKNKSKKQITEINLPKDISKMFEIVSNPKPKINLIEINSTEPICL